MVLRKKTEIFIRNKDVGNLWWKGGTLSRRKKLQGACFRIFIQKSHSWTYKQNHGMCILYRTEWPLFWLEKDILLVWFEAPRFRRTNRFQENLNLICDERGVPFFLKFSCGVFPPEAVVVDPAGFPFIGYRNSCRGAGGAHLGPVAGWRVGGLVAHPVSFGGGFFLGLGNEGMKTDMKAIHKLYKGWNFHHFFLLKSVWLLSPYSFHIIYALIPWIFDSGITQQQRTWQFAVDQLEKWQVGWRTSVAYLQGHLQPQLAIYFFGHWNGANFIFF